MMVTANLTAPDVPKAITRISPKIAKSFIFVTPPPSLLFRFRPKSTWSAFRSFAMTPPRSTSLNWFARRVLKFAAKIQPTIMIPAIFSLKPPPTLLLKIQHPRRTMLLTIQHPRPTLLLTNQSPSLWTKLGNRNFSDFKYFIHFPFEGLQVLNTFTFYMHVYVKFRFCY